MPHLDRESLISRARANRRCAHAPYSEYRSGAAVLDDDGEVHDGALVENVALGLSMCAERVALHSTIAAGGAPRHLVLAAPLTDGEITWPCGACLQTALELGGPQLTITAAAPGNVDAVSQSATVGELLPSGPFRPAHALGGRT
ncbi:MAG: cytidine deaminase [Actinomycetota bacterium]